ncbi:MAG: sulfite exporter TauE/SafE family protein [Gammaproteobacteria bacterium]|nr:sulfite exporter TauE/SafE family protein [Gammaproteobacteria bacterium]
MLQDIGLYWLAFPLVGVVAGVLAGLFGIGGGIVVVPVLYFFFAQIGIDIDYRMHLAIGSSLAIIVFTSVSSVISHHRRGAVIWHAVYLLGPGIVIGGLAGAALAHAMSFAALRTAFGLLVVLIALYIVLGYRPPAQRALPGFAGSTAAGVGIGVVASLAGIGGGVMTNPFLLWCGVAMRNAVATAAACTFPVAVAGALGFMMTGWRATAEVDGTTGYVFWPAVAGIAAGSMLAAPLGARIAHSVPVQGLRRAFALLLVLVGIRMLAA